MIFDPANILVLSTAITFSGVVVAVVLIWLATRNAGPPKMVADIKARAETLDLALSRLTSTQDELSGRLHALIEMQTVSQQSLTRTVEERLDQVTLRMGSSLQDAASKTAETLGSLSARLTAIDSAQRNITDLSREMVGLQDILSNKQARGVFGELQLSDLIRDALPPSAYQLQATLSNGRRADCLIKLPNPPGSIVVDAKFPLEAFRKLTDAETDQEYAAAEREFRTAVLRHVLDIAERYVVPGETAESALMFLPSEAVYAALHTDFTDVIEKSYRAKVWIVSPTTLMATLNTMRAVMKDAQMREQAGLIQKEVTLMLDDVSRLKGRVSKLQTHFSQADRDIREILLSADKVVRRGERIEAVQLEETPEAGAAADILPDAAIEPLVEVINPRADEVDTLGREIVPAKERVNGKLRDALPEATPLAAV